MKKIRAIWQNTVIAESDKTVQVEGNYYFHKDAINFDYLTPSETTTNCPWKGDAAYHTICVGDEKNVDAAFSYPEPTQEALQLKDHYAFWKGVEIVKETPEEKNERLSDQIKSFLESSAQKGDQKDAEHVDNLKKFLDKLGEDGLIDVLPMGFVNNLSFFNFYNSNDCCLQTDFQHNILRVNRTFSWAFNHIPNLVGKTFEDFMAHVEIIEGDDHEKFFKTIESHGWARLPKIKIVKNDQAIYYSLDVAITKHGDVDDLTGFQCQLKNITNEVELAQSVERSKANMKNLLEGIDEGLFYFDQEGKVAPERSAALARLLPDSEKLSTIQEIATTYGKKKVKDTESCLKLLWPEVEDDFMSMFEISVTMLPSKVQLEVDDETRHVIFEYKALNNPQGDLEKVIVVVKDVTELLRNEREANLQAERVRKISKAASNVDAYRAFVDEGQAIIERIASEFKKTISDINQPQLKRDLHTIKGMTSLFEYTAFADNIHTIEDIIMEESLEGGLNQILAKWNESLIQWNTETQDLAKALGFNDKEDIVQVEKTKIFKLAEFAKQKGDAKLKDLCDNLTRYDISSVFNNYATYIEKLVEKTPDKAAKLTFNSASDPINFEEVKVIDGCFVHILRNCMDHGIESKDERAKANKNEEGQIDISFNRQPNGHLAFTIKDDGGGIDGDKLAKKVVESGQWTQEHANQASHKDKINLIFMPNLSAKDEVSDISGRGVGMDAVRETLEELGGQISIESKLGVGTTFTMEIPPPQNISKKAS